MCYPNLWDCSSNKGVIPLINACDEPLILGFGIENEWDTLPVVTFLKREREKTDDYNIIFRTQQKSHFFHGVPYFFSLHCFFLFLSCPWSPFQSVLLHQVLLSFLTLTSHCGTWWIIAVLKPSKLYLY